MNTIYFDADVEDDRRRRELYEGQLFVYSRRSATEEFCDFARRMAEEAFAPLDPRTAQNELPVEDYVRILAELKPAFIHDPRSKELIRAVLREAGCDLEQTYFDLPRLRTATHGDYLKSGLAYAFKPHRDTWYSAPMCQLNWWLPVYEIESDNAMAFHCRYWDRAVRNSSREFNYQEWNKVGRRQAAKQVGGDQRKQSEAEEPLELDPQLRVICKPGGLLIFSAAHLHSTVPNTSSHTRFSIDFRTAHAGDLRARIGAPNLDSECTGTTIRDYVRGTDLTQLPSEVISMYETKPPEEDELSPQYRHASTDPPRDSGPAKPR